MTPNYQACQRWVLVHCLCHTFWLILSNKIVLSGKLDLAWSFEWVDGYQWWKQQSVCLKDRYCNTYQSSQLLGRCFLGNERCLQCFFRSNCHMRSGCWSSAIRRTWWGYHTSRIANFSLPSLSSSAGSMDISSLWHCIVLTRHAWTIIWHSSCRWKHSEQNERAGDQSWVSKADCNLLGRQPLQHLNS